MKALIFNSGVGKRMGSLTETNPKALLTLLNGETLFERQIRLLSLCGIRSIIVTTGPFEEKLRHIMQKHEYSHLEFTIVPNDYYATTNYIYSFYLAKEFIDDDMLIMHGDLVFSNQLIKDILSDERESLCLINPFFPLPEKDFKGRVLNDRLSEVSINIFDQNCFALQPIYKLSMFQAKQWINSVCDFVENKKILTVYAENALNEILSEIKVEIFNYENYYISEIDDINDYYKVQEEIRYFDYKEQTILNSVEEIELIIKKYRIKKPLVVCDKFLLDSEWMKCIAGSINPVYFSDFKPNPIYEDIVLAIKSFHAENCDSIISVGGGSAIDTAKAVKLLSGLNDAIDAIPIDFSYRSIVHIAIPTTAGTGSESTRYSVIYLNGEKQSITHDMILPEVAILDSRFLKTLPLFQKKATFFDALCQAIESIWSVNSTSESRCYSKDACSLLLANKNQYFSGDSNVNALILRGANYAGKAINISQTTAAHAMSYKITSLYNVPHGQAVAICLPYVWRILSQNTELTHDSRGKKYIRKMLDEINELFGCMNDEESIQLFISMLRDNDMIPSVKPTAEEIELLVNSVNIDRLKNFPIALSIDEIRKIYSLIFT